MRHGSLFSGIGGFDLAAQWMGWENVFHCEIDPWNRKLLNRHFPTSVSFKDVRDIYRFADEYDDVYGDGEVMWCHRHNAEFSECECVVCSQFDDEIGQIDILTGGFPCVDITNSKNAKEQPKGLSGEESGLWFEFERIIGHLRPKYIVVENSANLNVRGLSRVLAGITDIGYDSTWFTVPASRIGANHRRKRTYIISYTHIQGLEGNECKIMADTIQRRFDTNIGRSDWWDSESGFCRMADGISGRVDKRRQRLNGLGNAVVPQVAHRIFQAIEEFDKIFF